jgi:heavy metal sensor kinase
MLDSVRVKLTFWYTGVLALVLILFCAGVYTLMSRKLADRLDTNLRTGIEATTRLFIHEKNEGKTDQYAAQSTLRKSYFPHQAVAFYDAQGNLLIEQSWQGKIHSPLSDPMLADIDIRFLTMSEAETGGEDGLRIAAYRITAPSLQSPCFVVISEPLEALSEDLELLRDIFYVAVPLALLLAGVGGWLLARKALAPVVAMSGSARRIGAANLNERLPVANPRDELGKLAETFNELLGRLHQDFVRQQQFMADASHELRTPVSVIRTATEVTLEQPQRDGSEYREAMTIVSEQTRRLTRIVEEMLTLSRADAGQRELKPTSFYLDELVAEAARTAGVLAVRKGVVIHLDPTTETYFCGDEDLLRQMLLNLLDNAIKFTPGGGTIQLRLESDIHTHTLTVADSGNGIPIEAQPHIFERFYREDKARTRVEQEQGGGAGLGLSIARWVAEAHGGTLRLAQSGRTGSTFVITLPARLAH